MATDVQSESEGFMGRAVFRAGREQAAPSIAHAARGGEKDLTGKRIPLVPAVPAAIVAAIFVGYGLGATPWPPDAACGLNWLVDGILLLVALLGLLLARRRVSSARRPGPEQRNAALQAAEVRRLRALARVGERIAGVAHGCKNAVHNLRGFAALLEPKVSECAGALEVLRGLHVAVDQLEELSRQALELPADLRPGRDEGKATRGCEAAKVIDAAAREVTATFPAVRVRRLHGGGLPPLPLPPAILREALVNLFLNAAEAMNGRGVINVKTALLPSSLVIEVRDGGEGISPAARAGLFRPGFTTKPRGSGFGLFLARQSLLKHGGNLVARTRDEEGASFLITLPALATGCPANGAIEHEEPCAPGR
jgi:signal transduction histidine kinase